MHWNTFYSQARVSVLALCVTGAFALAACSGDDGLSEEEEAQLEESLRAAEAAAAAEAAEAAAAAEAEAAAEAARQAAIDEAARAIAEAEAAAEAARQAAIDEAARAVAEAAAAQEAAEAAVEAAEKAAEQAKAAAEETEAARLAQREAEAAQREAEAAQREAEAAQREAEQQLSAEEQQRLAAEQEEERLREEATKLRQEAIQAEAQDVLAGLLKFTDVTPVVIGSEDPEITPSYRAAAGISNADDITFVTPTFSQQGRWGKTSASNIASDQVDQLDVYSDIEAPKSVAFKDSSYNSSNSVIDAAGDVVGAHTIVAANGIYTASSAFPRTSGPPTSYDLVDRGMNSTQFATLNTTLLTDHDDDTSGVIESGERDQAFLDALDADGITLNQYSQYANDTGFRDEAIYPFRYTYTTTGTLQGASGTYRCGGETLTVSCTVQNQGAQFGFAGPWTFRPSNGRVTVREDDAIYMYFGSWSRHKTAADEWLFRTFHGPEDSRDTAVADVSGIFTYRGPAAGYYAIYQPLGGQSGHGAFTATATLTADFGDTDTDEGTVRGVINQFVGHPDWSVTLKQGNIVSGTNNDPGAGANGEVSWSIGGNAEEAGSWKAKFYSNIAEQTGVVPSGIAGKFEANYLGAGALIGAFGAHRQ